jgi:hypothetical protein
LDYPGISKGEGQPFATLAFANDAQACAQWTEAYRNNTMQPLSKSEQAANQLSRSVELIHPRMGRAGNTFGIISRVITIADRDRIQTMQETLRNYCADEAIARLENQLDRYDYDDALEMLRDAGRTGGTISLNP